MFTERGARVVVLDLLADAARERAASLGGGALAFACDVADPASVGAALIYRAVSTAKARGAKRFLANVQAQNVPFFERIHWRVLFEEDLFGLPHARMQADLAHYPIARLAPPPNLLIPTFHLPMRPL